VSPARPGSGLVLVVDDEPAVRLVVKRNLEGHGYRVEAADSGQQGLDSFERLRPDLVLLDLGLPDLDGFQVIRAIRETASTPIIVLSVRGAERDKVQALDLGADDYLTKPLAWTSC
jgi:two-component system KDP operon response regulator KdpE